MDEHILGFVRALRAAGVRVSPPEAGDALRAAAAVEVDDRDSFRAALRGTLVKRDLDIELFEELFARHFSPYGSHHGDVPAVSAAERALPPLPAEVLDSLGAELQELLDRLLAAGDLELVMLVRQAAAEAGIDSMESLLQQGMMGRTILAALGAGGNADDALDRFAAALRDAGFTDHQVRAWRDRMREQLDRLRTTVRGVVRDEFERIDIENRQRRRRSLLAASELGAASAQETAEMTRLVERLGHKLDSLPELRRRPMRRGALDMQRTWRANLSSGGVPFKIRWQHHRRRRPQVVALCDISNSVQATVRFMLHFLYRLQDRFSRVRSFVFVSDVVEVTEEFVTSDVDSAISRALQPSGIAYYSSTNYGRSLERFLRVYPDAVTSRTIVLVLGDGRGNYTPARAELLETLSSRARRLVWFNPESRLSWGLGDSSMPDYLPFCTQAAEVRTLAQLEAAIDAMVTPPQR